MRYFSSSYINQKSGQKPLTAHKLSGIVPPYILKGRSGAKEVMPMSNERKGITEGTAR